MVGSKTLADALTSLRFLLGFYLMWLGWQKGPAAIAPATLTLLAAWAPTHWMAPWPAVIHAPCIPGLATTI